MFISTATTSTRFAVVVFAILLLRSVHCSQGREGLPGRGIKLPAAAAGQVQHHQHLGQRGQHTGSTAAAVVERSRRLQNVSQTIEELLHGYDIRLRPQFGG